MKDNHTVGGKMTRNSRKIAILLLLFVLNQTIGCCSDQTIIHKQEILEQESLRSKSTYIYDSIHPKLYICGDIFTICYQKLFTVVFSN